MNLTTKIYQKPNEITRERSIDILLKKVIKCQECCLCCRNSSSFVLPHETARLRSIGVPLHKVDGVFFIKPLSNGRCPNLKETNTCGIYNDRPVSCRLFPFYLMNRPGFNKCWVLFHFCPKQNRLLPEVYGKPSISILRMIVFELEKNFYPQEINRMLKSDTAIARRDQLEVGGREFIPIIVTQKTADSCQSNLVRT